MEPPRGSSPIVGKPESVGACAMDLPTFLRLFEMRASRIMWFLGAGASAAAGVPTAGDMILDFKQKLFCSQQRFPVTSFIDATVPSVRQRIQAHLDSQGSYPPAGSIEEYSAYFEATYPSAQDRRAYVDRMVSNIQPSFGHHAFALLMKMAKLGPIWTTNFDKLIE